MPPDLWPLYESMLRCRLFEDEVAQLWRDGLTQSAEWHIPTRQRAGLRCRSAGPARPPTLRPLLTSSSSTFRLPPQSASSPV
jgi:hypothetical protein